MSQIHWISSMLIFIIIVSQCLFGPMISVAAVHIKDEKEKIKIDSISDSVLLTANSVTSSAIYTRIEPDHSFLSVSNGLIPSITTTNNNISVEYGVPELNISWVISDQNPKNYSILKNDEIIINNNTWTENMTVNVTITDLQVGIYEFMILAENILGNKANDTIVINVHDTTAPIVTILNPENGHEYNTTNLTLTISYSYYIEELSNYNVHITLNYFNVPDDGLLEYLPAGSYIFNVTVTDSSGNVGSDIVVFFVTIIHQPTTAKTDTSSQTGEQTGTENVPAFSLSDIILFLSIGIVFVVSVFVLIWRRNLKRKISSESKLIERYKLPPLDPFDLESNDD
ncbi:MAG: hypothetical protein ACFFFH_02595 [Candidatus Thorarchaeota archaeon]